MNRNRMVWYAAALSALVAAACFSDPTSSLRNGPSKLELSRNAITVRSGDSIAVTGTLVDAQGNPLPTDGATWTSADPAIARVTLDTVKPAPGEIFTRAFVTGVTNVPGVTTVTVTVGGVTDSTRVTVLPATFPGTSAVSGTPGADTVTVTGPPPQPAPWTCTATLCTLLTPITAGDTLVLTAPAGVSFTSNSAVSFGPVSGIVISQTATTLKAIARGSYAGKATVTNLTFAGTTATGAIAIASLQTDSITIQHARFRGTSVITNDPNFGTNTVLTVTAPAGVKFDHGTQLSFGGAPTVGATAFPPQALIRLAVDSVTVPNTVTAISPATVTNGSVLVLGALIGTVRIDSLRIGTGSPLQTINKSSFPGTVTTAGKLLDTITVSGGTAATFTTAAATASQVTVGGTTAFVLSRSATTMKVIAKLGSSGPVSISNVIIGGVTVPSLATAGAVNVSTSPSGELNEPGNQSSATATPLGTLSAVGDTLWIYGAMDGGADQRDYYTFTMGASFSDSVNVRLDFFGNGSGSSDVNPDFDVVVCTTLSGSATCSYGQDIIPNNGASVTNQPETGTTPVIAAGTTVFVRTFAYFATAAGAGSYRLRVKAQ